MHTEQINGTHPGDPDKAADVLIEVFRRENPPLHLLLGGDAVKRAEHKLDQVRTDIESVRALSVSTDF